MVTSDEERVLHVEKTEQRSGFVGSQIMEMEMGSCEKGSPTKKPVYFHCS